MLRTILVLAILIPGFITALRSRFAALLLYLWFAMFRPQEWLWFDISSLRLSLVLGLVLLVPSLFSGIVPNLSHPLSLGAVLFLLIALVSQTGAVDPATGWLWLDFLFRLVVVCLLAISLISTRRRFVLTLAVVAGSFGFHSARAGVASLMGGGLRFYDGLAGAFIDNNGYALGTVMTIFLLIPAAQNIESRWARWALFLAVPMSGLTVISTFSRAGFLALLASTAVFLMIQRRKVLATAAFCVIVGVVAPFVSLPEGYSDRIETIRTYEEVSDNSALGRPHFWRVAVEMARDRPLGVGLRNYEAAYDQYDFLEGQYGRGRSVHSSHMQVLAETGFAGAAVYLFLFVSALFIAFCVRSRAERGVYGPENRDFFFTSANGLIASMCGFLVGGSFIALALNDLTWLTFAFVAALHRLGATATVTAAAPIPSTSHEEAGTAVGASEPSLSWN